MSKGVPHITNVDIPDIPAMALGALEGGLASVFASAGMTVTVIVSFGDGKVYEYPDVLTSLALAVQTDPEGAFPNIRFWPGYHRIR
jgi:hypothetical protein